MDTHFLTNMEEHLPNEIMKDFDEHRDRDEIKYIGRGAIHIRGPAFYKWMTLKLNAYGTTRNQSGLIDVYG